MQIKLNANEDRSILSQSNFLFCYNPPFSVRRQAQATFVRKINSIAHMSRDILFLFSMLEFKQKLYIILSRDKQYTCGPKNVDILFAVPTSLIGIQKGQSLSWLQPKACMFVLANFVLLGIACCSNFLVRYLNKISSLPQTQKKKQLTFFVKN